MKRFLSFTILFFLLFSGGCTRLDYDAPEDYLTGGGAILTPVRFLSVDWQGGKVRISQTDGDALSFTDEVGTMCYRLDGDKLYLQSAPVGDYLFPVEKTLTVQLPAAIPLQMLTVHTLSADIFLSGVPAADTRLTTATGNASFAIPYDESVSFDIYGGFSCALPVKRRDGKYICGEGDKLLSFQSTEGALRVEVWEP